MYLEFDENRPDTPRVPSTFTRLERVLLAVVAYQALLVSYLLVPDSFFARPIKALIPDDPIRYVSIEPRVERTALPRKPAPPSDLDRRSSTPTPVPRPQNPDPISRGDTPEKILSSPPEQPRAAETPQPVLGSSLNDAPPAPRVPGGILGSAMRALQHTVQSQNYDNPTGGGGEQGSDIQFDSKGVDFGAWLRRFRAQVYTNWMIPSAAQVMHGHVVIQMRVLRNGTVSNVHIIQSSGIGAFDSAAETALKLSNPTMKLPDAYPGDSIDPFTVTFYYNEKVR